MSALFNHNSLKESSIKQKNDTSLFTNDKQALKPNYVQLISSIHLQEIKSAQYSLKPGKEREELHKIQSEIAIVEERIRELELAHTSKLAKIGDLRQVIRRLADEESFTPCLFKQSPSLHGKTGSSFMPRERCDKRRQQASGVCRQTALGDSSSSCSSDESQPQEDPQGIPTGKGDEQGDNDASVGYSLNDSINDDCLLSQALCFWQEHLPALPKGSNRLLC